MEALEDSGIPFSYFPVMIPHASGDQVIAPTPVTMETRVRVEIRPMGQSERGRR